LMLWSGSYGSWALKIIVDCSYSALTTGVFLSEMQSKSSKFAVFD
jgi:hypothetical protein